MLESLIKKWGGEKKKVYTLSLLLFRKIVLLVFYEAFAFENRTNLKDILVKGKNHK